MELAAIAGVTLICVAALAHQWAEHAQQRWLRQFQIDQQPHLELVKLRDAVEARLLELEKANRAAQFKKLG